MAVAPVACMHAGKCNELHSLVHNKIILAVTLICMTHHMHRVLTLIMLQQKVNMSSFPDNSQDLCSHNYFSRNQWK